MDLNSLIAIVVCVIAVVYGTYLSVTAVTKSLTDRKIWDQRLAHHQLITPLRLQAYERMTLFMERITPNNLVLRVAPSCSTAAEFHQQLLKDIREEFNHNLAQQIYLSEESWELIRNAKEEVVTLVNLAAQQVTPDASVTDLARQLMALVIEKESMTITVALSALKKEIQALF